MTMDTYLALTNDPIRFEAVSQLTNVFFDDSNKQIFAVRSGGVMGVSVKGPDSNSHINFRMEDHGPVISIKFSPDRSILGVQRSHGSVEFSNFINSQLGPEYSQSCRKNSSILGFVWTQIGQVAFVTDYGVELYQVLPDRKTTKLLKTISASAQWFAWNAACSFALLASGHGTQLQPVTFKAGTIAKLPKLELDVGRSGSERDVTLSELEKAPAVLLLSHGGARGAEVLIYQAPGPGQAMRLRHVLILGQAGRFAINVLDDLVLVHHQASRTSSLFDIGLPGESDGCITHHLAIAPARPFRPFDLQVPGVATSLTQSCELYSPNWVVFQPNIIIDAKLGCLWYIELSLEALALHILDLERQINVLRRRKEGRPVLLRVLRNAIMTDTPLVELQTALALVSSPEPGAIVLDQDDIYTHVLAGLEPEPAILVAYVRALARRGLQPQHHLSELLVTALVRRGQLAALQQLLRHGAVADSKPLACLLLSLGNLLPAATQLALDMLSRLGGSGEAQEVLLSRGSLLAAARLLPPLPPRKLLDSAIQVNEPSLFHTLYRHSQQRVAPDHRKPFDQHYSRLFDSGMN